MDERRMDQMKRQEVTEDHKEVSVPVINPDSSTGSKKLGVLSAEGIDPQVKATDQKVYVLDGGFVKWQEKCATPLWL